MRLIPSERNGTTPYRPVGKWDAPQSLGGKCRDPSLRPNEMSELLTAPEWNGLLVIGFERGAANPRGLERKRDVPQSIGMKCRNRALRQDGMSELLTAPVWNGMPRIELLEWRNAAPPREQIGRPEGTGVKRRTVSLQPNGMECPPSDTSEVSQPPHRLGRRVGCRPEHRNGMSQPRTAPR
jgi:hypothetical protein